MSINPLNSLNIPGSSNISRVDSAGVEKNGSERADSATNANSSENVQGGAAAQSTNPIQELPEIREEVIQQALQKLESGYYQSREAAVQTAKAILGG